MTVWALIPPFFACFGIPLHDKKEAITRFIGLPLKLIRPQMKLMEQIFSYKS